MWTYIDVGERSTSKFDRFGLSRSLGCLNLDDVLVSNASAELAFHYTQPLSLTDEYHHLGCKFRKCRRYLAPVSVLECPEHCIAHERKDTSGGKIQHLSGRPGSGGRPFPRHRGQCANKGKNQNLTLAGTSRHRNTSTVNSLLKD